MQELKLKVIAHIKTAFKEKFGIPRQSGRAPHALGKIVFKKDFQDENAIKRIEEFSHLWLIFDFSLSHTSEFCPLVRPPRLGGNEKVGVFASRSPFRPNPIGLSSVKLESVEKTSEGLALIVSGVDLLDGTPIFDIKPYIPSSDCHVDAVGGYADNFTEYKLKVEFQADVSPYFDENSLKTLIECLSDDPRPSYHDDGKIYGMAFENKNVKFTVNGDTLTVIEIE